jgi:hypothetical protein
MSVKALSTAPGTLSYIFTRWPARAKTIAQARPINPEPMIAIFSIQSP